jgi:hypothetical protein
MLRPLELGLRQSSNCADWLALLDVVFRTLCARFAAFVVP